MTEKDAGQIEIEHVMPGAHLIRVGQTRLALGFPEEVVKGWMRAGCQPNAWLVPDLRSAGGIVQWALEFPLYFALFVQGYLERRERVPVLVHRPDWADVVEYLRLTLLGLTRREMEREGVERPVARMLARESQHLALKHPDGTVVRIEDALEPRFFDDEGLASVGALRVRRHGDNTYSFFAAGDRVEEHRLEPAGPDAAPYGDGGARSVTAVRPQPFEITLLGASNGFDPAGPCSNLVVQAGGRFVVVDCGPYVRATLRGVGISVHQIGAVVLTHAHEDHAVGLSALLDVTTRLKLFVTRETAAIMRRKLAILNPTVISPDTLLDDTFEVVCVAPGEVTNLLGLEMRFHYTMHSIPCAGVELTMRNGAVTRRALVTGDNSSRANIERAAAEGALPPERLEQLLALYRWDGDLLVADAGGGLIHGVPSDFRDCPCPAVVCVHTPALAPEERGLYTLAEPGHRYTLIAEHGQPSSLERAMAHRALAAAFTTVAPDELGAMLDASVGESVNRGQVVVRQGDRTDDLFVVLTGELAVTVGRRRVALIAPGEIFGEMAAVTDAPRSATVQALTAARLIRVPGSAFRRLAAPLLPALPVLWENRADLERVGIFSRASVTVKNTLARRAVRRAIAPGSTLVRQGSSSTTVYVLVRGRVQVYRGGDPLLVEGAPVILDPGTVIGETAPFLRKKRNASIVTLDACEVLAIRGRDFESIVRASPQLHHSIARVVRQRRAA